VELLKVSLAQSKGKIHNVREIASRGRRGTVVDRSSRSNAVVCRGGSRKKLIFVEIAERRRRRRRERRALVIRHRDAAEMIVLADMVCLIIAESKKMSTEVRRGCFKRASDGVRSWEVDRFAWPRR
jgi:hypothetical protein